MTKKPPEPKPKKKLNPSKVFMMKKPPKKPAKKPAKKTSEKKEENEKESAPRLFNRNG